MDGVTFSRKHEHPGAMGSKGSLTKEMKRLAVHFGADLAGIAPRQAFADAPAGHRPQDILRGAKSVVVIAVALPRGALEKAPSREYSASYMAANAELNRIAFRMAKALQEKGYRAVQVPASPPYDLKNMRGDLSHRHAGELAGLGVFGKNSLLLSPIHGARIRLVSVITDADLSPDKALRVDLCADCIKCIESCPAKALKGNRMVDKMACDDHHIRVGRKLGLAGGEQVCGVCIRVCPVGSAERGRPRENSIKR